MTDRITQISKEEMEPIVTARTKAIDSASAAEKALNAARVAELEFKVNIQQLYLMKGLDPNCRVDIATGSVSWPEDQSVESIEQPKKRRGRKPAEPTIVNVEPEDENENS